MKSDNITKKAVSFWMAIIILAVTGAIAFTKLEGRVDAMAAREQINIEKNDKMYSKILDTNDRVIKIEKDIEYIKAYFGTN